MCVDCEDHFIMTSLLFLHCCSLLFSYKTILFFFFNDTATTEIYTLSLHDALPISGFIDTHWHLWTSLLRPFVRADVADRKSTRLNSSHLVISYAVFCLKKKITN